MSRNQTGPVSVLFATILLAGCGAASEDVDGRAGAPVSSPSTREVRGAVLESGSLSVQIENERAESGPVTRATFSRTGQSVSIPCMLAAKVEASGEAVGRVYCVRGTDTGRIMGVVDISGTDTDVNMDVRYFGRAGDAYASEFETITGAAIGEGGRLHQTAKLTVVSAATRPETDPLALVGRIRSVIAPMVGKHVALPNLGSDGANRDTVTSVSAMVSSEMTLLLGIEVASDRDAFAGTGPKPIALLEGDGIVSEAELKKRVESELYIAD